MSERSTELARALPGTRLVTRLSGVSFHQEHTAALTVGDELSCVHEADNPVDPACVRVLHNNQTVGYIPARNSINQRLCATSDGPWTATVMSLYDSPTVGQARSVEVVVALTGSGGPPTEKPRDGVVAGPADAWAYTPTGRLLGQVTAMAADGHLVTVTDEHGNDADYPRTLIMLSTEHPHQLAG